jgi:AmmeMemoRadiSam system protein A
MNSPFSPEEQRFLLQLARRSIEGALKGERLFDPKVTEKKYLEKRGAFVSLKVEGELRGCIGYPLPYKPLYKTIIEMAAAAATQDFRFAPLRVEDLPRTKIEISVLTLPEAVRDPQEVEVGRHGIIISKGGCKGLLLPQVPAEYSWDRETFLCHGCLKAGLDKNEWQRGAKVEVFEAQVFSE